MPRLLVLALGVSLAACGCVTKASGSDATSAEAAGAPASKARVQAKWQEQLLSQLNGTSFDEAYGLFSEGGWADNGQFLVLVGKQSKVQLVPPARKAVGTDRALTDAEQASVTAAAKQASGLKDLDVEMYDGIVYEYVHAVKDASGKASVVQRTFIRNPGNKPEPPYDALIKAFLSLRPAK